MRDPAGAAQVQEQAAQPGEDGHAGRAKHRGAHAMLRPPCARALCMHAIAGAVAATCRRRSPGMGAARAAAQPEGDHTRQHSLAWRRTCAPRPSSLARPAPIAEPTRRSVFNAPTSRGCTRTRAQRTDVTRVYTYHLSTRAQRAGACALSLHHVPFAHRLTPPGHKRRSGCTVCCTMPAARAQPTCLVQTLASTACQRCALWALPDRACVHVPHRSAGHIWEPTLRPWEPQSFSDGRIEVCGIASAVHLGLYLGCGYGALRACSGIRLAQAASVRIETQSELHMQVDGEPWLQPPGSVTVELAGSSAVLHAP